MTAAYAQAPVGAAPFEEVLVTGSLIRGTQAVGVPVTALAAKDFQDTGAITIADLLKNVPAISMQPTLSPSGGGGNQTRTATIDIHKLGGPRSLMLVDGMRYSMQKEIATSYDPSIIPAIALDRVDVLADGASATYGSDAVAGVVNIILRRGFDGAVSQVRVGATNDDVPNSQESQLFGRKWDSGDITVSFEHWETAAIPGSELDYYTTDFTPWGLDNQNSIKSSFPGIVSTGAISPSTATVGTGCVNCYSIPKGQNGVGLAWTTLLANQGVKNEINPYSISQVTNAQQRNGATVTVDQRLTPEVELFAEGFYSNRRTSLVYPPVIAPYSSSTLMTVAVPTNNPFYPIGAPPGLQVSYDFAREMPPLSTGSEISGRYAGGFNLNLPFDWRGKIFASFNQENTFFIQQNSPNANNVKAALGTTVPATAATGVTPAVAAYTKPANVPYLNLFCDPTAFQCNSQATLDYIRGYASNPVSYIVHQYGANFDGPLFALPAGDLKAAVGASYSTDKYSYETLRTRSPDSPAAAIVVVVPDILGRQQWAAFGQLNAPIVSDANAVPLIHKLDVEVSYRYDHFSDFGGTSNPKLAVDWMPLEDLTLRGSWGTSFRAPQLTNLAAVAGRTVTGVNTLGGANNNTPACQTVGGVLVAPANTAAALLNPTCNNVGNANFPGGIQVQGGTGGLAGVTRPDGYTLVPEKGRNLNLGLDFTPTFLPGLDISATWYKIHITNVITTITLVGNVLSNPASQPGLIVAGQPGFAAALAGLVANPESNFTGSATNISWILDTAARNNGTFDQQGVDFTADYDWDMGTWGAGNTGITGDYTLHQITTIPGSAPTDLYDTVTAPLNNGQPLAFRLKYRAHLGWSMDGFSATVFADYTSHISSGNTLPPAAFLATFPNYSNKLPAQYLIDLSLGYDTGDGPANTYLKNLSGQFVVNNIFNRDPPFAYTISGGNGSTGYLATAYGPYGRTLSFTLTKTW